MYIEKLILGIVLASIVLFSYQSSFVYTVAKGKYTVASVDGLINKDQYRSGIPVDITIIDPINQLRPEKLG